MKITQCTGEGQGECKRCADKGKWNRMWMSFLYHIEGMEGCYCEKCVREIEIEDVLRTLEKLYNDYLIRPDECKALDWAIRFIKEHTKTGLEKMIADCERHIVCKGCPHEKECE